MSLLGELALAFLIESIALAALWVAMGAAAGWLVLTLMRARPAGLDQLRGPGLAGLAGAVMVGSLSARLGVPEPILLAVGRREIPILWSIGGAVAGALVAVLAGRKARTA